MVGDPRIASDPALAMFLDGTRHLRSAGARLVLFGSRAREDWRPDSDYDILVVLPKRDRTAISQLYDVVIDVLSETGRLVSLKIFGQERFDRLAAIPTPFMANVLKEGVDLGRDN
jgi:hypothetical protein